MTGLPSCALVLLCGAAVQGLSLSPPKVNGFVDNVEEAVHAPALPLESLAANGTEPPKSATLKASPVPLSSYNKAVNTAPQPRGLQTGYMALDQWPDDERRELRAMSDAAGVSALAFEHQVEKNLDWLDVLNLQIEENLAKEAVAQLLKQKQAAQLLRIKLTRELLGVHDEMTTKFVKQVDEWRLPPIDGVVSEPDLKEIYMQQKAADNELVYNKRVEDATKKECVTIRDKTVAVIKTLYVLNDIPFNLRIKHALFELEVLLEEVQRMLDAYSSVLATEVSAPLAFTKLRDRVSAGTTELTISAVYGFIEGQLLTLCPKCPNEERIKIAAVSESGPPGSLTLMAGAAGDTQILTLESPTTATHQSGEVVMQGTIKEGDVSLETSMEFNTPPTINGTKASKLPPPSGAPSSANTGALSKYAHEIMFLLSKLHNESISLLEQNQNLEIAVLDTEEANAKARCEFRTLVAKAYNITIDEATEEAMIPLPAPKAAPTPKPIPTDLPFSVSQHTINLMALAPQAPAAEEPVVSSSDSIQEAKDLGLELRMAMQNSSNVTEPVQLSSASQPTAPEQEQEQVEASEQDVPLQFSEKVFNKSFEFNAYDTSLKMLDSHMDDWFSIERNFPKARSRLASIIKQLQKVVHVKEEEISIMDILLGKLKALQNKYVSAVQFLQNVTLADKQALKLNPSPPAMPTNPWPEKYSPDCVATLCNKTMLKNATDTKPPVKSKPTVVSHDRRGHLRKRFGSIDDAMNDVIGETDKVQEEPASISHAQMFGAWFGSDMPEARAARWGSGGGDVDRMPESVNSHLGRGASMYDPNTRVSKVFRMKSK